jgi:hypothetical protein
MHCCHAEGVATVHEGYGLHSVFSVIVLFPAAIMMHGPGAAVGKTTRRRYEEQAGAVGPDADAGFMRRWWWFIRIDLWWGYSVIHVADIVLGQWQLGRSELAVIIINQGQS